MTQQKNRGFTLIELLVLVLLIVLISTIGVIAVRTAHAKGRDAKRLGDLRQIVNALELFSAKYNYYPGQLDPSTGLPTALCGAVTCTCGSASGPATGVIGNHQTDCLDIDNALAEFLNTAQDPKMLTNPSELSNTNPSPDQYFYFYHPGYICNGSANPTVQIMNVETSLAIYHVNPCTGTSPGAPGSPELADYLQVIFFR